MRSATTRSARSRGHRFALLLVLLTPLGLGALSLGGCFKYDEPSCAYKCGAGTDCPESYQCRSDGYCHRAGSVEACMFSDAAAVQDLSATVDQGADQSTLDSGADL